MSSRLVHVVRHVFLQGAGNCELMELLFTCNHAELMIFYYK